MLAYTIVFEFNMCVHSTIHQVNGECGKEEGESKIPLRTSTLTQTLNSAVLTNHKARHNGYLVHLVGNGAGG